MSHSSVRRVALVGTGIMGAPIGGHLLDAGLSLTVHNRTREKAEPLLARGARWASSPAEAAQGADMVLTCLGYPSEVEDVYLGTDGLVEAARHGMWLVDLSTSSPTLAREIHDACEVGGAHAFDCPVTGGEQGAKDGTLTACVGAREADVAPAVTVIRTFARRVFFFDEAGAGQVAKLCNQVSLAGAMVGYAEAMRIAEEGGLPVERVLEMVGSGMGDSRALEELAPRSLEGDFRPGFKASHLRKDLQLALDEAEEHGYVLPGTECALMIYRMLCDAGGGNLGTQALTLLYGTEEEGAAAGLDFSRLAADAPSGDAAAAGAAPAGAAAADDPARHRYRSARPY